MGVCARHRPEFSRAFPNRSRPYGASVSLCETPERRPRANALGGEAFDVGSSSIRGNASLPESSSPSPPAARLRTTRRQSNALDDDAITVGSFNFAESDLLAEIYSQALERGGYHVRRAFDLGPREFVAPALARGLVELVPEYAGTALQFSSLGAADLPRATCRRPPTVSTASLEKHHVTALAPAPAPGRERVRRHSADRRTASTFAGSATWPASRPSLTFGGPPECPSRPQCLAGLEQVYGLKFKEFVRLDTGGPVDPPGVEGRLRRRRAALHHRPRDRARRARRARRRPRISSRPRT